MGEVVVILVLVGGLLWLGHWSGVSSAKFSISNNGGFNWGYNYRVIKEEDYEDILRKVDLASKYVEIEGKWYAVVNRIDYEQLQEELEIATERLAEIDHVLDGGE